jgi:hypothetical protein
LVGLPALVVPAVLARSKEASDYEFASGSLGGGPIPGFVEDSGERRSAGDARAGEKVEAPMIKKTVNCDQLVHHVFSNPDMANAAGEVSQHHGDSSAVPERSRCARVEPLLTFTYKRRPGQLRSTQDDTAFALVDSQFDGVRSSLQELGQEPCGTVLVKSEVVVNSIFGTLQLRDIGADCLQGKYNDSGGRCVSKSCQNALRRRAIPILKTSRLLKSVAMLTSVYAEVVS